jgi:hypothetical protein
MKNSEELQTFFRKGKIIEIEHRKNKHHYIDLRIKNGVLTSRCSLYYNLVGNSELNKILKEFNVGSPEELKDKECIFKYFIRKDQHKDQYYFLTPWYDIKSIETYEKDKIFFDNLRYFETPSLRLVEDTLKQTYVYKRNTIPKKESFDEIRKNGPKIRFNLGGVRYPIAIIDFESFYANIIINNEWKPKNDFKEIYLDYIKFLKNRKDEINKPEGVEERNKIKLLLEISIGCLKNKNFLFYDPELHSKIIEEGKKIIDSLSRKLKLIKEEYSNKQDFYLDIIRIHTDGIIIRIKKNYILEILKNLGWGLNHKKHFYPLNLEGFYKRGIFKGVNDFALIKEDNSLEVKGRFFKNNSVLIRNFLEGYYPLDFSRYEEERENILKSKLVKDNVKGVIQFLEECKPKK